MLDFKKRKLIEEDIIFAVCEYVYSPENPQGFLDEHLLREIADILEEKNKPMNHAIKELENNDV